MKAIRWFNRHLWFLPACALIAAALLLVFCARPLLRWVGWPYDAHLAWFLRVIAAGVLVGLSIGILWGVGVGLRLRLTGREVSEEIARVAETCDPEPLLLTCRELQTLWLGEPRPKLMMAVQLGMAEAAGRLGRVQEAEQELNRLLPVYKQYKPAVRLTLELCAATVRLWACRPEEARSFLTEAERHLKQMTGSADSLASLRAGLEDRKRLYRLVTEGGSEELLAEYRQALARVERDTLLNQTAAHMNVARCLLDLGRPEEARPHLEFVAANGNKLAIRAEAEDRLAALTAD